VNDDMLTLEPSEIRALQPQLYAVSPGHSGVPVASVMLMSRRRTVK
jgi:hypothetical protein